MAASRSSPGEARRRRNQLGEAERVVPLVVGESAHVDVSRLIGGHVSRTGRAPRGHNGEPLMSDIQETDRHSHNPLVRYFRILGPGLVTGASDDDPSGITTYSVAGASLGYGMLWTALATFPLMAAVQLICARIGLVTGRGLAATIRRHYPRPFLYVACLLLLVANVFNIAADLAGMSDATRLLTGVPSLVSVPAFGLVILLATVYMTYARFAQYLKWLTAVLFAYIIAAYANSTAVS